MSTTGYPFDGETGYPLDNYDGTDESFEKLQEEGAARERYRNEKSLGDKLMAEHQGRQGRDELLASAMTIGKLREIIKNIGTDRDDVPVVLSGEPHQVVIDWRGEWWGPKPVLALYCKGQGQGAH